MQTTILVQKEAPSEVAEQLIESMRLDENILSIVVARNGNEFDMETSNSDHFPKKSSPDGQERFYATDLLSNNRYTVAPWKEFRQLSITLGRHEIIATVDPKADIVEIASCIGSHITDIVKSN